MRQTPILWLLLPVLIAVGLFFGALILFGQISFMRQVPGTAMISGPMSLDNYREALAAPLSYLSMASTFRITLFVTVVTVAIGYPLAYLMARATSAQLRNAIIFALIVTFLSGGITRAYAWMLILGNNGPINRMLVATGIGRIRMVNNETGVIISLIHFSVPFFVFTMLGAIKNIPPALEEAARSHGASRLRAFLEVTLPLSVPGLISAIVLTFSVTISAFLFPLLLGGGRVIMAANLIYERLNSTFNMPAAAAMSFLFLAIALLPILVLSGIRAMLGRRFGGTRR